MTRSDRSRSAKYALFEDTFDAPTDTTSRNAKPTGKPVRIFDGGGLYVEISPAGGKLWRLKYRIDGKDKLLALGMYPDVGLKDARERRDEARKLLANGVDPGAHRKAQNAAQAERSGNSFEVICREWLEHSARTRSSHPSMSRRWHGWSTVDSFWPGSSVLRTEFSVMRRQSQHHAHVAVHIGHVFGDARFSIGEAAQDAD